MLAKKLHVKLCLDKCDESKETLEIDKLRAIDTSYDDYGGCKKRLS